MPPTPTLQIFTSLPGTWHLRRTLNSALPYFPSGTFTGTATFQPRAPTSDSAAAELLYAETGTFKSEAGHVLRADRKYVYRYNEVEDRISAWFVTEASKGTDGAEEVEDLFHELEVVVGGAGTDAKETGRVMAGRGEHLCQLDMYWAYYEFRLVEGEEGQGGMDVFGVKYKVKGPEKDYTSDAAYQRA